MSSSSSGRLAGLDSGFGESRAGSWAEAVETGGSNTGIGIGFSAIWRGAATVGVLSALVGASNAPSDATIVAWAEPSAGTQHCVDSLRTITSEIMPSELVHGLHAIGSQWRTNRTCWDWVGRQARGRLRLRRKRHAEAESTERRRAKNPTIKTCIQRRTNHLEEENRKEESGVPPYRRIVTPYVTNQPYANCTPPVRQTRVIGGRNTGRTVPTSRSGSGSPAGKTRTPLRSQSQEKREGRGSLGLPRPSE